MARKQKNEIVADVCMYGTRRIGLGWGAQGKDGRRFGDCTISPGLTGETIALWMALDALENNGYRGMVRVFAPGGEVMAITNICGARQYWGDLKWQPAPVYTISAEEIAAAAS